MEGNKNLISLYFFIWYRSAYNVLVLTSEGSRVRGRCKRRREYNIKMDLKEMECEVAARINLAQDTG
jgi:hypothetical protein